MQSKECSGHGEKKHKATLEHQQSRLLGKTAIPPLTTMWMEKPVGLNPHSGTLQLPLDIKPAVHLEAFSASVVS